LGHRERGEPMRRFFAAFNFLFISVLCFSQQIDPVIKQGSIPRADDPSLYEIQVGAFAEATHTANAFNTLSRGGFSPVLENIQHLTRVIVRGIPAGEVMACLERIGWLGFREAIIRKDTSRLAISEKWNISGDQGSFSSLEFTQENRYIAVEKYGEVYFGEYNMPVQNIINMNDLGIVRIGERNNNGVNFSFAPVDDPSRVENISAVVEAPMQKDRETDLFTRAWKVINLTRNGDRDEEAIGVISLFSINGTYLVVENDGYSFTSRWRWVDDRREEFEYSHNNWATYGRVRINSLTESFLNFNDYTFRGSGRRDYIYDLVPHITN
jgi:hypothetical protein